MAIKMDGHTITELKLKASDGSEVTKQLTEEGTIPTPTEALSITANGTYDVTDKASAVVNVPAPEINLQNKTATANGEVTADEGYDGLGVVTVAVSGDTPTYQEKTATANGVVLPDEGYDALSKVTVAVPTPEVNLQNKTITENGTYSADVGYDGLGEVVVNVSGGGSLPAGVEYHEVTVTGAEGITAVKSFSFNTELTSVTSWVGVPLETPSQDETYILADKFYGFANPTDNKTQRDVNVIDTPSSQEVYFSSQPDVSIADGVATIAVGATKNYYFKVGATYKILLCGWGA